MSQSPPALPRKFSAVAIVPVALFGILALGFLYSLFHGDPSHLNSALIGKPAPQFTLAGIPGVTVPGFSTADLGSGKVSIVNVWASWCIPCREEQPLLGQVASRLKVPLSRPESAARRRTAGRRRPGRGPAPASGRRR